MTFRDVMAKLMVAGGAGLLAQVAVMQVAMTPGAGAQAPRYQSPYATPSASTAPALPTPTPISANGSVVEDVVVRVNGQIIDRSDVERAQAQMQQELAQDPNLSAQEREDRQKNMLRDMIDQQLLLSKAKELGLNADAEVVRRLDEIRKQNHLADMDALEKAARQQGVNFEDFKANIRNQILTQEVVRDEVGRKLQLSQGQEQAYYDAHKQDFQQPEQERLSEILIPLPADASADAVAQAQKKAEMVDEQVKAGKSFEELAKQFSGGQTAANGGDLGVFKRGALAKVLEDDTFALKAGQATAPIRTRQGFVILKVTEHQDAGVPPLKQVEPQIQEAMYVQQMQPALRAYLTRLREEAYIDIKPGFVDAGASARQSKPVFTAYQAPQPKKKKVQEKARFDRHGSGRAVQTAAAKPAVPALPTGNGPAVVPTTVSGATPVEGTSALVAKAAAEGDVNAPVAKVTTPTAGAKARQIRVTKKGKVKVRREKIRFGQAPRNALPGSGDEVATTQGSDVGAGAVSAAVTPGGTMAEGQRAAEGQQASTDVAPGVAMAPNQSTTQLSASSDADPLAPKVETHGKVRFASRDKEFRERKAAEKEQRVEEKTSATPQGPGVQEAASREVQSAPLGLNGNTAVKKKKKEKVKGAPKERMQEQKAVAPVQTPVSPTVNPKLGANTGVPAEGGNQAPDSNEKNTTLPASTAAPGAPPQGQPLPPDGTPATTPNGTPAPQPQ